MLEVSIPLLMVRHHSPMPGASDYLADLLASCPNHGEVLAHRREIPCWQGRSLRSG